MRYIGTSWKMNHTVSQAKEYAKELAIGLSEIDLSHIIPFVIPPFVCIENVRNLLPDNVFVGAQNMHWSDKGAYTGEISAHMLKELGVELVEIGHSERREYFNETDQTVRLKVKQALQYNLRPLICIGEPLAVKNAGGSLEYLARQLQIALAGVSAEDIAKVLLAYEPIWAIGEGGIPAEAVYVGEIIAGLKERCTLLFPHADLPILYGGSVTVDLVSSFLELQQCDGLFVGRAAWTAQGLLNILQKVSKIDD